MLENRQVTRWPPTKDVAQQNGLMPGLGANVLKHDQHDTASMEAALKGIFGAFLVTHFYLGKEKEGR